MKYKEIIFLIPEKLHADFKIRLMYDKMAMTKFVKTCLNYYLDNDVRIIEIINEQKEKDNKDNKKKRQDNIKLIKKGKELARKFGLTEEDVSELYDVLEKK